MQTLMRQLQGVRLTQQRVHWPLLHWALSWMALHLQQGRVLCE
jgi:hypothetical protein